MELKKGSVLRNQKGGVFLGIILVLVLFYVFLFSLSFRGWGYPSYYGGYAHGPSFWYFGGPRYYSSGPSLRGGSTGGPNRVGGGPGRGK
ncbi:MAG: hypothetical protein GXO96_00410 [Nitrospirae bacterium]|nr:hypothetical protein [Candidatus Manganitrophaceae bacterium]